MSAMSHPATSLKLKIRVAAGGGGPTRDRVLASGLTRESTWSQLQHRIADECAVPVAEQEVCRTYPPPVRIIEAAPEVTLATLNIHSGDALLLKRRTAADDAPIPAVPTHGTPASAAARPTSPPKPQPASLDSLQASGLQPLRVVKIPDDNSCLFNSVGLLIEGAHSNDLMHQLRQIVAAVISTDEKQRYDEAFLNARKEEYTRAILNPVTWGGGIELAILADYYNCEIVAIDVETCHLYTFGGDSPKSQRIYCVYSGVHYDALVDDVNGQQKGIFSPQDKTTENRALLAARLLQQKGAFTNLNAFTLRCSICQKGLVGAREAHEHASATGHAQFEEYAAATK